MKDLKQKSDSEDHEDDQNQEGGDITQLDGSPEPQGVSKVALGGTAKTLYQHDEDENVEWIDRLRGKEKNKDLCDIEDAYAMLFEGLAGIMRAKSWQVWYYKID